MLCSCREELHAAGTVITGNGLSHVAAKATKAAAPEAAEASTAASRRGHPMHGYEPTREAAMAAFAKSWWRGQF